MRLAVVAAVACSVIGLSFAQESQAIARKYTNIPPQGLGPALQILANERSFQVVFVSEEVNGVQTAGTVGELTVDEALTNLLAGTGLSFRRLDEKTMVVGLDATKNRSRATAVKSSTSESDKKRESVTTSELSEAVQLALVQEDKSQTPGGASALRPNLSEKADQQQTQLEELVVTGTHIRGAVSAGSNIQVLSRKDLDASGYATLQDVLTKALPQNYGGGPSEDFNTGNEGNFNAGTGVNLRGLGSDATLVLVNGRRQAASGTEGGFVDISSIPVSAIERVEVLSDGASALYGSDAVGGVVNIILRNDFQGAESRVRWGSASGGVNERLISQVMGTTWASGNFIGGIQFNDRDALPRSARRRTASEDKRPFGGDDFRTFLSNPGNILDPATFSPAYAIPANQDGSALTPASLLPGVVNLQDYYAGGDLLPDQEMISGFLEAGSEITDRLSVSAHTRYSHRKVEQKQFGMNSTLFVPASNPYFVDPFGGSPFVFVTYSFLDDLGPMTGSGETNTLGAGLGAEFQMRGDWRARLHVDYGEEETKWSGKNQVDFLALDAALADPDPATAFNPFGDGSHTNPATLDLIRTTQREHSEADLETATLIVDGKLFELASGSAKLALGMDYRDEGLEQGAIDPRALGRDVFAGFAELAIPLLRDESNEGWRQQLELSVAARYEDYSDFGTTSNPKVGIAWSPHELVGIRGSWGTSFRAPKLVQLDDGPGTGIFGLIPFVDPQSATGQSLVLAVFGNNSELKEETATVWTAGLDFGLWGRKRALSITYYDIEFEDRIAVGGPSGDPSGILLQEEQWSEIIDRTPSPGDIEDICNSPDFFGNPTDCTNTPPDLIIDFRLRNLALVQVNGIDVQFTHDLATNFGDWELNLNAARMLNYERAVSPSARSFDILDTVGNPPSLQLRGGLAWRRNGLSSDLFVNYADDYDDNVSQPNRKIGSWTTLDLRVGYATPRSDSWLSGFDLALSVTNATDKQPPFYNSLYGYDIANADLLGRVISAQVTKSW